jgi:hypothetical protein
MNRERSDDRERPAPSSPGKLDERFWRDLDEIAKEINASWPKGVSAEDAISDVRRDL